MYARNYELEKNLDIRNSDLAEVDTKLLKKFGSKNKTFYRVPAHRII